MPSKNIVIFVDGTGQDDESELDSTNVLLLFENLAGDVFDETVAIRDNRTNYCKRHKVLTQDGNTQQVAIYLRGVSSQGTLGGRIGRKLFAGTTGFGVVARIKLAYQFLCQYYNPGDRVFLFGFSRGAYVVRCLANFVQHVGLLLKDYADSTMVDEAYEIFSKNQIVAGSYYQAIRTLLTSAGGEFIEDRAAPIDIHFIGVWDVVSSTINKPKNDSDIVPEHISHVRHALAIHEFRPKFKPVLWTGTCGGTRHGGPQSLQQVWFPGAHSDIGGGYRATQISKITLIWIFQEAEKLHLIFKDQNLMQFSRGDINSIHASWRGMIGFLLQVVKLNPAEVRTEIRTLSDTNVSWPNWCFIHYSFFGYLTGNPDVKILNSKSKESYWTDAGVGECILKADRYISAAIFNSIYTGRWPFIY